MIADMGSILATAALVRKIGATDGEVSQADADQQSKP
jgi:hypothetical protein